MNIEYPIPELPADCIVVRPGAVDGDTGIYPNETTTLEKELGADGIPARTFTMPIIVSGKTRPAPPAERR